MSRTHHPETVVVPVVVRVIVVANRDARVVHIVVPRAAPQRYPVGPRDEPATADDAPCLLSVQRSCQPGSQAASVIYGYPNHFFKIFARGRFAPEGETESRKQETGNKN